MPTINEYMKLVSDANDVIDKAEAAHNQARVARSKILDELLNEHGKTITFEGTTYNIAERNGTKFLRTMTSPPGRKPNPEKSAGTKSTTTTKPTKPIQLELA